MSTKEEEAAVHLLTEGVELEHQWPLRKPSSRRDSSHRRHLHTFLLAQLFLITVYTTLFFSFPSLPTVSQSTGFPPTERALSLSPKLFLKAGHLSSPFSAPPSPSTDRAWMTLLHGGSSNMAITSSEMDLYSAYPNATSVRLTDGSGYLAKLGFYHELHCLHKMKRWLYPEYYFPEADQEVLAEEKEHLEHCIEWIRTAALCRGDTTLTLFEWIGERLETKYPIPHMCVDEGELLRWGRERSVDIDIEGILEGPE